MPKHMHKRTFSACLGPCEESPNQALLTQIASRSLLCQWRHASHQQVWQVCWEGPKSGCSSARVCNWTTTAAATVVAIGLLWLAPWPSSSKSLGSSSSMLRSSKRCSHSSHNHQHLLHPCPQPHPHPNSTLQFKGCQGHGMSRSHSMGTQASVPGLQPQWCHCSHTPAGRQAHHSNLLGPLPAG